MAASLAYYTAFSLAPLLIIAIAIGGLIFGERAALNAIADQVQGFVGPDRARSIQTMIQSAYEHTQGIVATIIGVVTLLIGASGVFGEIQDALNTIWHVRLEVQTGIRQYIKSRLLSFGMVLSIGFLLLVSLLLSALLAGIFKYVAGLIPAPGILFHALEPVVSLAIITALCAVIFKILPKVKLTWNDVFLGAFATALLFAVGEFAIGLLGNTISGSSYGAAASIILVIAWIYYSALILYFGAEFTHVYTTEFRSVLDAEAGRRECGRSDALVPAAPKMPLIAPSTSNDRSAAIGDARRSPAHIRSEFQLTKADIIAAVTTLSLLLLLIFGRKRLRRVPLKLEKTF
jgi:membrane protein